ncbi:MAG: hypothetical protein Q8O54_03335, partial [Brevundimonas sp.]|nr:hypothetical protein [Brevundimonas sp.]
WAAAGMAATAAMAAVPSAKARRETVIWVFSRSGWLLILPSCGTGKAWSWPEPDHIPALR